MLLKSFYKSYRPYHTMSKCSSGAERGQAGTVPKILIVPATNKHPQVNSKHYIPTARTERSDYIFSAADFRKALKVKILLEQHRTRGGPAMCCSERTMRSAGRGRCGEDCGLARGASCFQPTVASTESVCKTLCGASTTLFDTIVRMHCGIQFLKLYRVRGDG